MKRRLHIAKRLFNGVSTYSNENHQCLIDPNTMVLGAYSVQDFELLLPIALQARLPAYLAVAKPNLSKRTMRDLDLETRAKDLGLYDRLREVNILPHGGGYTFPHFEDVLDVHEIDQIRYFELSLTGGENQQLIRDVRNLPYAYRGNEVIERVEELELGTLTTRLDPVFSLKL
jgi:hypothetical protein